MAKKLPASRRQRFAALGELSGGSLGRKFGFSVQLNDNDGRGKAARMRWGVGIEPHFDPKEFGAVTFVE